MAYMLELDVDEYGMLDGGEEIFPVKVSDHDRRRAYPPLGQPVEFTWEQGDSEVRPNVFYYPYIDNFVCDVSAYEILSTSPGCIHTIATGELERKNLFLVQVTTIIDCIVDLQGSVIQSYPSYEILAFPAFRASKRHAMARRIFRVPENLSLIFVGVELKRSLDEAGIRGFRYLPVDWVN
ncbi:hypothetical protein [Spirillospora sp. NPDC048824]|uniref:hypothetical protein n=1 Tax=Spirillospora sp. NPDC048824 TaxID=3364526 RepID=UPI00371EC1A4